MKRIGCRILAGRSITIELDVDWNGTSLRCRINRLSVDSDDDELLRIVHSKP